MRVTFYLAHRGFEGAVVPLPEEMLNVGKKYENYSGDLDEIVSNIRKCAERNRGRLEVSEEFQTLFFFSKGEFMGLDADNCYRLLRYIPFED